VERRASSSKWFVGELARFIGLAYKASAIYCGRGGSKFHIYRASLGRRLLGFPRPLDKICVNTARCYPQLLLWSRANPEIQCVGALVE
jgi:hypothetical protein